MQSTETSRKSGQVLLCQVEEECLHDCECAQVHSGVIDIAIIITSSNSWAAHKSIESGSGNRISSNNNKTRYLHGPIASSGCGVLSLL